MGISCVQTVTPWSGGQPVASGSFTPNAGDAVIIAGLDNGGTPYALSFAGTGTYSILTPPGQYDFDTWNWATAANVDATAGAQTVTLSSNSSGDFSVGWGIEYSGVGLISASANGLNNPGAGAGAIIGNPVTVPVGGVLVALCIDHDSTTVPTVAGGGAVRESGIAGTAFGYCYAEYAGSGGSITPAFTSATGASDRFVVIQWLLTPNGLAAAADDATSASGVLTGYQPPGWVSFPQWNVSGVGDAKRRIITAPLVLATVGVTTSGGPGAEPCGTPVEIYPLTIGTSGSLTITDNGVTVFTIAAADIVQGVPIPIGVTFWHDITVSEVPAGGEYGVLWEGTYIAQ